MGGIQLLMAGASAQHGPAQTDHMEEKNYHPDYYTMRNKALKTDAETLRAGKSGFTGVYADLTNSIRSKGGRSGAGPAGVGAGAGEGEGAGAGAGGADTGGEKGGGATEAERAGSGGVGSQSDSVAAVIPKSNIFRGVVAYVNGFSGKYSAFHITKLLQLHGGNTSWTFGKTTCTHQICVNVSGNKKNQALHGGGKRLFYVTPEWVLKSIEEGTRLPEHKFCSLKDRTVGKSVADMFGKGGGDARRKQG